MNSIEFKEYFQNFINKNKKLNLIDIEGKDDLELSKLWYKAFFKGQEDVIIFLKKNHIECGDFIDFQHNSEELIHKIRNLELIGAFDENKKQCDNIQEKYNFDYHKKINGKSLRDTVIECWWNNFFLNPSNNTEAILRKNGIYKINNFSKYLTFVSFQLHFDEIKFKIEELYKNYK